MKSILTVLIFTASFLLVGFTANEEQQLLTVKYTVNDWQNKVNMIEYTKNVLKQSNVPANVVLPLVDSLTKFENELIGQIQVQLPKEQKK